MTSSCERDMTHCTKRFLQTVLSSTFLVKTLLANDTNDNTTFTTQDANLASDGPNRAVSGTRQGDTNTHIVEGIRDGIISEDHTTQGSSEFIPDLTYSMTDRMDVVIQEQSLPTLQQAASILSSLKRKRDETELEIRVSMKKSRLFCWKVDRGGVIS